MLPWYGLAYSRYLACEQVPARRAKKELAEREVAKGKTGWGLWHRAEPVDKGFMPMFQGTHSVLESCVHNLNSRNWSDH